MFPGLLMGSRGSVDLPSLLGAIGYWIAGTGSSQGGGYGASGNDVTDWTDGSGFGSTLIQHVDLFPDGEANGWNGASPAIDFEGGEYFETAAAAPITTATAGSRAPFSVCCRCQFDATGQQTLCAWQVVSGSDRIVFGISSGGKLQLVRQAASGSPEQFASPGNVGTNQTTVGVSFYGDGFAALYINGANVNGSGTLSGPFDSATISTNIFKVGTGPLLPNDGMDGRIKALLVSSQGLTDEKQQLFHNQMAGLYP